MSNTNIWFSYPLLKTWFSLSTSHFCKWQNSSSWVKSKLQEWSLAPILFLTLLIEYLIRFYCLQIEYIHDIDLRFYSHHLYTTWRHGCFFPKIMQEFLFLFCLLVTHSPKNSRSDLLETEFRSCQYPAVNSQMISNHPSPRRPLNTPPSHFLHLTYYSSDILNFGSWNWPGPYPSLPSA